MSLHWVRGDGDWRLEDDRWTRARVFRGSKKQWVVELRSVGYLKFMRITETRGGFPSKAEAMSWALAMTKLNQ